MRTLEYLEPTDVRSPSVLRRIAFEQGCDAVICDDDEIQVDLDTTDLTPLKRRVRLMKEKGLLPQTTTGTCWYSKSGNWHVVLKLPEPMDAERRIMFALMLGSDEIREILNLAEDRADSGTIVLFRPRGSIVRSLGNLRRRQEG